MTKQEYFDLLKKSATDGAFPSHVPGNGCFYRKDLTPACPSRCAAGLLIDDKDYFRAIECRLVDSSDFPKHLLSIPEGMSLTDVKDVQGVHDTEATDGDWDALRFIQRLTALPCFQEFADA